MFTAAQVPVNHEYNYNNCVFVHVNQDDFFEFQVYIIIICDLHLCMYISISSWFYISGPKESLPCNWMWELETHGETACNQQAAAADIST